MEGRARRHAARSWPTPSCIASSISWVHRWRQQAHGCISIVRYADDFVMGFESEAEARRMLVDSAKRLAKFGLALHENKTRLILFGKFDAERRHRLGRRRPERSTSSA